MHFSLPTLIQTSQLFTLRAQPSSCHFHIFLKYIEKNDKTLSGNSVSTEMNAVFIVALKTLCYIISQCFLTHIVKSCEEFEILPRFHETS